MGYDDSKFAFGFAGCAVIGTVLIMLLFGVGEIVDPGHAGVLVRLGDVHDDLLGDGWHWKRPITDSVVEMDIRVRKHQIDAQAGSKDLQTIRTIVAVNYKFNPKLVPDIYRKVGDEATFEITVLEPATHEAVKAVVAQFNAEELLKKRAEVRDMMEESLRHKLDVILQDAFIVAAFNVIDFDFTESFNKAIEGKQVAEQKAQQAQNEIVQARAEADKKIEKARGEAERVKLIAEGKAAATLVLAEARAAAIAMEGKTLQENPQILRLRLLEKWDGTLPRVTSSGTGFDLLLKVE